MRVYLLLILFAFSIVHADQHLIYWNSTTSKATNECGGINGATRLGHLNAQTSEDLNYTSSDGAGSVSVELLDQILFICPHYNETYTEDETEQTILYLVSEEDYGSCTLRAGARAIGQCLSPFERLTLSIVIRSFTPLPSAPEFRAGRSYYIVSTSTGSREGLKNRKGGLCAERDLKLTLHVQPRTTTTPPPTTTAPATFHSRMLDESTDAPVNIDPTPDLEAFLEKLNQPPTIGHGGWWNPSSAPDYVPLPPATKRGMEENTLYRITEYSDEPKLHRRGKEAEFWQNDDPKPPTTILFEIQEGPWTAGYSGNGASLLHFSSLLLPLMLLV